MKARFFQIVQKKVALAVIGSSWFGASIRLDIPRTFSVTFLDVTFPRRQGMQSSEIISAPPDDRDPITEFVQQK
jgi:hypothetical protein